MIFMHIFDSMKSYLLHSRESGVAARLTARSCDSEVGVLQMLMWVCYYCKPFLESMKHWIFALAA